MVERKRPHGSYDDIPPWFQPIAMELRAFIREAREDRKQAAEDRKQAAEDRKQAAEDRKSMNQTVYAIVVVAKDLRASQKYQTSILEKLTDVTVENSKTLKSIERSLRARSNGSKGNGRGKGR